MTKPFLLIQFIFVVAVGLAAGALVFVWELVKSFFKIKL
jgi:hypothetical protein